MQNQNNLWFYERFGSSVQQQNVRKENKNKKIYNEINGELAKRLSIRRHEELERRYSFYNVENEIFEEHKSGVQDEENDSEEEVEMNDSATTKYDGSPKMKRQKFDYLEENQINNPDKDEIQKVDENKQEETNDEDTEIDNSIDEEEEIEELNQEDEENKEYEECYDEDDEQESDHSLEKTIVKKRRIIEDDDNDDEEKMKDEKIEEQEARDEQQNFTKENDLFTCEDEVNEITENLESFIDQEAEISDLDEMDENEEDLSMLTPTPQNRKDLLDDEASLSGDDVGSDADDNDQIEGMDEYEAEEGDLDELPEDEEIRDNLVRQYMKHQKDADDRKLLKLQEAFFADSDLHGKGKSGDRSFRLRMHDDSKVDWAKILGTIGEKDDEIEKEEEDEMKSNNGNERRAEMLKWKLEEEKKRHQRGDHDHEEEDEFLGQQNAGQDQNEYEVELNELEAELASEDCKLFKLGEEILGRIGDYYEDSNVKHSESSNSMSNKRQKATFNRDSLLTKATCLENLLKEGKNEKSSSTSAALFTTQK